MARGRRARRTSGPSGSGAQPRRRRRYFLRPTRRRRAALMGGDHAGRRCCLLSDADFRKRLRALILGSEAKALKVASYDMHKEKNREKHFTTEYDKEDLIVRRGQGFDLSITFDRPINKETDTIILQLSAGARPQESKGTLLRLPLLSKTKPPRRARDWTVDKVDISGETVNAVIIPYARAKVGSYDVYVETKLEGEGDDKFNRKELEDDDIYVLFNAWCKDDPVYMADQTDRDEYVLNEYGRIWCGSANRFGGRPWFFGQFDAPCLEAALTLLDNAELGDVARGSVVSVIRAISAMTNSNDEDGVLEGNWSGDYAGGTKPWIWSGSVAILKEFMKNKKPVKYGQCWVFSAISTTLCRALGIPTRSVTNFESAHDTDNSMTIDKHWTPDGEPADEYDDSVWNFHVWNESFLRRLDLPDGYDGWQAHDATPQELSEGVMRCGPASLKAIKEGHVYLSYDTSFIFGEVNGDKVDWTVHEDGSMEPMNIRTRAVGKFISTKAKGSTDREDVTHLYKYPEGSEKERQVVKFANRFGSRSDEEIYMTTINKDVEFELEVPDSASVSEDFQVTMVIRNKSEEARSVKGRMTVLTSYYTGIAAKRIDSKETEVTIQAKQQEKIVVKVTCQEFQSKLNAEASFQANANYRVKETKQQWADTEAFTLTRPPMVLKVPEEIKVAEKYVGTVTFTNPLKIKLTNSSIHVEGGVSDSYKIFQHKKAIQPGETINFEFEIKPRYRGRKEVEAAFSSDQLSGIDGSVEYRVT